MYLNPKWGLEISNGRHACLDARFCLNIRVRLGDMSNIYDVFAMILFKIKLGNIINIKLILIWPFMFIRLALSSHLVYESRGKYSNKVGLHD